VAFPWLRPPLRAHRVAYLLPLHWAPFDLGPGFEHALGHPVALFARLARPSRRSPGTRSWFGDQSTSSDSTLHPTPCVQLHLRGTQRGSTKKGSEKVLTSPQNSSPGFRVGARRGCVLPAFIAGAGMENGRFPTAVGGLARDPRQRRGLALVVDFLCPTGDFIPGEFPPSPLESGTRMHMYVRDSQSLIGCLSLRARATRP